MLICYLFVLSIIIYYWTELKRTLQLNDRIYSGIISHAIIILQTYFIGQWIISFLPKTLCGKKKEERNKVPWSSLNIFHLIPISYQTKCLPLEISLKNGHKLIYYHLFQLIKLLIISVSSGFSKTVKWFPSTYLMSTSSSVYLCRL